MGIENDVSKMKNVCTTKSWEKKGIKNDVSKMKNVCTTKSWVDVCTS